MDYTLIMIRSNPKIVQAIIKALCYFFSWFAVWVGCGSVGAQSPHTCRAYVGFRVLGF